MLTPDTRVTFAVCPSYDDCSYASNDVASYVPCVQCSGQILCSCIPLMLGICVTRSYIYYVHCSMQHTCTLSASSFGCHSTTYPKGQSSACM